MEKTAVRTTLKKKERGAKKTMSPINEPLVKLWGNEYDEIWNNA